MKKNLLITVAILAAAAFPAIAGEWHTGSSNLCTDCHTMHFSMTHKWGSETPIGTGAALSGDWLGSTGPNEFLLKAPANQLCQQCHDGQTFAPDVVGVNTNAGNAVQGRQAGGLATGTDGYETYMGHEIDTTKRPPGYDAAGPAGDAFPVGSTLECTSCHTQHGIAGVYRNLGPRAVGTGNLPKYVVSATANDTTKDVWIKMDAATLAANSGNPGTFSPFYEQANVFFNRIDKVVGSAKTSNGIDTQCASCHGVFHGGPGDPTIGGSGTPASGFIRPPTSQEALNDGAHGSSNRTRLRDATIKVKVYTNDYVEYTDATPGCVSCHKAHGNKNPFGLIFLSRTATTANEEGGNGTEPIISTGLQGQSTNYAFYQRGSRNLCGQCHGQGN